MHHPPPFIEAFHLAQNTKPHAFATSWREGLHLGPKWHLGSEMGPNWQASGFINGPVLSPRFQKGLDLTES